MSTDCSHSTGIHARHGFVSIGHPIPTLLDYAAERRDVLGRGTRYERDEVREPDPDSYPSISEGLRAAASRIRTTRDQMASSGDSGPRPFATTDIPGSPSASQKTSG